ncbi:SIR2 family protein [Phytobacter diazotrophicus]|uniref:SIR2 family protein n=1 Tax=Phytobacter diazotrophicus TaxID=395631 RepID=UPI002FF7E51F
MLNNQDFPCNAPIIVDKNINFLFGSGASASYIPTLRIDDNNTYETLLTDKNFSHLENYIYWNYFKDVILPTYCFTPENVEQQERYSKTLGYYKNFISELVGLLNRRSANHIRRANIFTTNYDLFVERSADELLSSLKFHLNDGSNGLINKQLDISNFHISTWHQGTHDSYRYEIPMINLIKMHGSVSWSKKNESTINIDYLKKDNVLRLPEIDINGRSLTDLIDNNELGFQPEFGFAFNEEENSRLANFRENYNKLAIVSPTKEKFKETVFQQHYYQSLRLLSYELEKPQSVLICFGFSFQDEHIREIIKRSLSNPTLKVFIFCYKKQAKREIETVLNDPRVTFICPKDIEDCISFKKFTAKIFNMDNSGDLEWKNL